MPISAPVEHAEEVLSVEQAEAAEIAESSESVETETSEAVDVVEALPANEAEVEPIDEARAMLERAHEAAEAIGHLNATIRYAKMQGLLGEEQIRFGKLDYRAKDETTERPPQFRVHFDRLMIDGNPRPIDSMYIYDGRWLAEVDTTDRVFIRRELVAEGETSRLMELGEGPFALPLSMNPDTVMERFEVTLLEPLEDRVGVLLIPREGYDVSFERVTIFYDPETMLPREAMTVENEQAGDVSSIRLLKVAVDDAEHVEDQQADNPFDTSVPEEDGWTIETVRLRAPAAE